MSWICVTAVVNHLIIYCFCRDWNICFFLINHRLFFSCTCPLHSESQEDLTTFCPYYNHHICTTEQDPQPCALLPHFLALFQPLSSTHYVPHLACFILFLSSPTLFHIFSSLQCPWHLHCYWIIDISYALD